MLLRSIKQSFGRYLAILGITALGVGFYCGLKSSQPAMRTTAAVYFSEQNMYDFQLLSSLGYTEEEREIIASGDGITAVEGGYFADANICIGEKTCALRVMSLTSEVSVPLLIEGRMPENAGECLADELVFDSGIIGTKVYLSPDNSEETQELLPNGEFAVVGLAKSPRYLSKERGSTSLGSGELEGFIIVPPEAFDSDAWYEMLVCCCDEEAFSDAYADSIEAQSDPMERINTELGENRYRKLRKEADDELADARKELDDGWEEYYSGKADAEKEIADARQEIADGREEIRKGLNKVYTGLNRINSEKKRLENSKKTLDENEAELKSGQLQLNAAKDELAAKESELAAGRAELDGAEAAAVAAAQSSGTVTAAIAAVDAQIGLLNPEEEDYASSLEALENQKKGILENARAEAMAAFAGAEAEYSQGKAEIDAAKTEVNAQQTEIDSGIKAIADGRAQIAAGEEELERNRQTAMANFSKLKKAEKELDDAETELNESEEDAKKELSDALRELEDGETDYAEAVSDAKEKLKLELYTLDRESNSGCATFKNDIAIIGAAAKAFPVFFVLVAAFVCITTMTRMVNEERTQIGTMKALGYSTGTIMSKYLFYSGSAAAVGCIAGFAAGITVIPLTVWTAYNIIYSYTGLIPYFSVELCVISSVVAIAGTVAATGWTCRKALREKPAELMRPKAPASGKRILLERVKPVWNRLSFLTKVMLRNAFRYPSRVIMMLLGIGGCTALLIAGFGCKDSIAHVLDYQYEEIFLYDMLINFKDSSDISQSEARKLLSDADSFALTYTDEVTLKTEEGEKAVTLLASDREELNGIIDLHKDGENVAFPEKGCAVVSGKAAQDLNIKPGDKVSVTGDEIGEISVIISGVFDNYLGVYIVVSPDTIGNPGFNSARVCLRDDGRCEKLAAALREEESVEYVSLSSEEREIMAQSMESLNVLIMMLVVCSGALAFITIYNLTNINIMERIREIATVKVLGFRREETGKYILNENILLSLLGTAAGIPLGKLLHRFVMELIQVEYISYDIRITAQSYLLGCAISAVFSVAASKLMQIRIEKVNMAESLKSVE